MIVVLIIVMAVSLATTVAVRRESLEQQREREMDLLFAGQQFRNALASYRAAASANGSQQYPQTLDDLVLDQRSPTVRRHLRRVYSDPMTGKPDWILETIQGRIVGLHSSSIKAPIRHADFPDGMAGFSSAQSYREWRFLADGIASDGATTQVGANQLASPSDSQQPTNASQNGNSAASSAASDPFAAAQAQCGAQYGLAIQECYSNRTPGTNPTQCAADLRALMRQCLQATTSQ